MTFKPPALWAVGLLVVLLVAGAGYFSLRATDRQAAASHSLRPDDPQVLRVGARIYTQQCAACHGAKGEGQPDWRD
ncbi:MAG: cytochrome c class I, partial [uncultured bacterium]